MREIGAPYPEVDKPVHPKGRLRERERRKEKRKEGKRVVSENFTPWRSQQSSKGGWLLTVT